MMFELNRNSEISSDLQNFVESVITLVFDRLPPYVKVIIAPIGPLRFKVYKDSDDGWFGYQEDGTVYLNMNEVTEGDSGTSCLMWAIAHELAHGYLNQVGSWAIIAVQDIPIRNQESVLDGLGVFGGQIEYKSSIESNDRADMQERMADAIALSWGFGKELIARIRLRAEKPVGALGERPAYLHSDIQLMAEMLNEIA